MTKIVESYVIYILWINFFRKNKDLHFDKKKKNKDLHIHKKKTNYKYILVLFFRTFSTSIT